MDYRYNYSFLKKWMRENGKNSAEILNVIGISDYNALRRWISGEKMLRIDFALRICNAYNIPISCFFVNMDRKAKDITVPIYEKADAIEPMIKSEDKKRLYEVRPEVDEKKSSDLPARWAKLFLSKTKDTELDKAQDSSEPTNDIEESKVLSIDEIRANFKQKESALKKQLIDKDNIINNLSKALSNVTGLTKEPYKHIDDTGRDLVCEDLNK